MADYTKGTGAGQMLIRDLGTEVQFHIRSGYSSTWVGSPGFDWSGYTQHHGNFGGKIANYSGDGWRHIWSGNVTHTQDVKFGIGYSGTSGFGGPTDFWQNIYRAPVGGAPNPPTNLRVDWPSVLLRSAGVHYDRGGTNGSAITADQVFWSRNAEFTDIAWQDGTGAPGNGPNGYSNPAGAGMPDLFEPGRTYWVRARSDSYGYGWSGWSNVITVTMRKGGWVKVAGVWKEAVFYVKVNGVWVTADPYLKVGDVWKRTG